MKKSIQVPVSFPTNSGKSSTLGRLVAAPA